MRWQRVFYRLRLQVIRDYFKAVPGAAQVNHKKDKEMKHSQVPHASQKSSRCSKEHALLVWSCQSRCELRYQCCESFHWETIGQQQGQTEKQE